MNWILQDSYFDPHRRRIAGGGRDNGVCGLLRWDARTGAFVVYCSAMGLSGL